MQELVEGRMRYGQKKVDVIVRMSTTADVVDLLKH